MTVIRKRYEDQLNDLLKDLRALGLHTYSMLQKSVKVLSDEEITHARQIVKSDRKINQMEYDINEKSCNVDYSPTTDCERFKNDDCNT